MPDRFPWPVCVPINLGAAIGGWGSLWWLAQTLAGGLGLLGAGQ